MLLEEQLQLARSGRVQLVIVGGEAGIGKTTLARDLARLARESGFQVLVGQCHDLMAAPPFGPWLDMIERLQASSPGHAPVPPAFAGNDLAVMTSQAELFAQVREFLRAQAAAGPILLVLEDAHWADPASLDLLRHVVLHARSIPLLVLVTYRVDELTRQHPFYLLLPALIRESEGLRIDLKPLTRHELEELVAIRYSLPAGDAARLVDYLDAHADGNPFFVSEILRALEGEVESGLRREGGGWRLAAIDRFVVPALVRQVIEGRARRLGDTARDALAVAAVIGHNVPLDLWSQVAGLDEPAMLEIVDRAVEHALLTASPDGLRVQFVHAITRETFYQGIVPPRRRLIHRAVAVALQERSPANPDPISHHLQQAGDPAAPEWLIRAGERAQRAYAWLTARDRFLAAAELLAERQDQVLTRARLLYRCGRLQRYSNAANGIEDLALAARLARQAGDRVLMSDAIYSEGLLGCFADKWVTGLDRMVEGIEDLEALPPEESRSSWSTVTWMADALPLIELPDADDLDPSAQTLIAAGISHRRGGVPWFMAASGRLVDARSEADRFLRHVEGTGTGPLVASATAHSLFGLGIVASTMGEPDLARASFRRSRGIYRQLDHHAVIAFSYLTDLLDVMLPWYATDLDERARIADEGGRALERAGGALPSTITARHAHLPLMYLEGRWQEARLLASGTGDHGTYVLRRQLTNTLAPIALHQGNRDDAWRHVRSVLPGEARTRPSSAVLLDALMLQRIAVDLCLDAGDLDEAKSWLAANRQWLHWSGAHLGRADHELAAARVERAAGDLEAAAAHARRGIDLAAEPFQPLVTLAGRRILGGILLDQGEFGGATVELRAALNLADACAAPFERALCLEGLARAHLAAGAAGADPLLHDARTIFTALGAAPALERIGTLPQTTGAETAVESLPAGLTARELDVLRLVAHGLTDAEVAARLYISPRTVGQHLRSTYGKLGVRSRAAATRFAIEHGIS